MVRKKKKTAKTPKKKTKKKTAKTPKKKTKKKTARRRKKKSDEPDQMLVFKDTFDGMYHIAQRRTLAGPPGRISLSCKPDRDALVSETTHYRIVEKTRKALEKASVCQKCIEAYFRQVGGYGDRTFSTRDDFIASLKEYDARLADRDKRDCERRSYLLRAPLPERLRKKRVVLVHEVVSGLPSPRGFPLKQEEQYEPGEEFIGLVFHVRCTSDDLMEQIQKFAKRAECLTHQVRIYENPQESFMRVEEILVDHNSPL